MKKEILIGGSGGQGIILLGNIIGKAATRQGLFATQVSTHGSAQRGIPVNAELIISDKPVKFSFVQKPDYFIALSNQGFDKFNSVINDKTLVFIDSDHIKNDSMVNKEYCIRIPASTIAKEIGNPIGANFVILGKFLSTIDFLSVKIIEDVIKQISPQKFINKNLEAFQKSIDS